tara:strand:+ start:1323 stop:1733 length:411 start_codon:yes stop_codon:yes gene_type:complete
MSLVSYEPWNLLDRFYQQLNHLPYSEMNSWRPAVDIKEEKDCFLIIADVPGVDPKDIDITMENGILTIKGERCSGIKSSNEKYKRLERTKDDFYRCFSLPDTADSERIEAKGANGVLKITIPKYEKVQPRRIEVKS